MGYKLLKKAITVADIQQKFPLSRSGYHNILAHREDVKNILSGKDKRLLLILGPCSAWPFDAVIEYADKLSNLNKQVEHKIKILMRCYTHKPRTINGWVGPANQPDPLNNPDIEAGIYYARKLMVHLVEKNIPIADEALFTHNTRGFLELLTWVAIGARSSEDQEHRIFASSLDCPVGIKNPTSGSIKIGVNGVIAAQHKHVAIFDGYEIETSGNQFAHLVLRGGSNKSNYSVKHLLELKKYLLNSHIANPGFLIDVSHDNSLVNKVKDPFVQGEVIFKVLEIIKTDKDLTKFFKGFMLESFLKDGNQKITQNSPIDMEGLSITDPCLGWPKTEILINQLLEHIGNK